MTKTQLADHVLRLANKAARARIRALEARLKAQGREGMLLFNKYSFGGIGPGPGRCDLPHEIEDFLQSAGGMP